MSVNKHLALQEYIQAFVEDNHLNFEAITMIPNYRAIVPTYGEYVIKEDILGAKYKQYDFMFIAIENFDLGTGNKNTSNMNLIDSFIEWIETQEANKNYPDFGANTSEYTIMPLQNMANLALVDESTGTAKYMLGCRINYKEE